MAIKKNYPEKYGWWISELNSLGINTEAKDEELTDREREKGKLSAVNEQSSVQALQKNRN